jgi:predicted ATPase
MDFPQLLTEAEAAEWLGVPIEAVAMWARDGKLLAAARTEGGQLLFYRWRVEHDGTALAAFAPIRTAKRRGNRTPTNAAYELNCGCRLSTAPGHLCRTGAALLATAALAEEFATSAPEDKLLDRIASLCRDALSRHLTSPLMRGDLVRAVRNGVELTRLACEHDLPFWQLGGVFFEGLAKAESGPLGGGLEDMRRGAQLLREQNVLLYEGLVKILLAETEARAGDVDRAVAVLDEALATSERIGNRTFEAELHRVRGGMLLRRNPANPAPAEEALQAAIAVAKRQGTRSFELRAALALANFYQSTARPTQANAVLAPALEGFAPTPEMPEIAEAKALLATLDNGA